jgi:hypothetical protein
VAKPKTLNQIVAIEKTVKQRTYSAVDALYKAVQKPEAFTGYSKTYQPKNDADDVLPPESKVCERIARDVLAEIAKQQTELFDVVATKDRGNTVARADVVIDDGSAGVVLLTGVPATTLLFFEKHSGPRTIGTSPSSSRLPNARPTPASPSAPTTCTGGWTSPTLCA